MESPAPARHRGKKRNYIIVGVLVFIAILLLVLPYLPSSSALISGGTVEHIKLGHYYYVRFNSTGSGTLSGDLSSNRNISLYVLSPSQYSFDVKYVTFVKNSFNLTNVKDTTFSVVIPSGIWYFVLLNPSTSQNATVTVNYLKLKI